MFTICIREFTSLFKSIRSVIIIGAIFGVTVGIAKVLHIFESDLTDIGASDNIYAGGLFLLLLLVGPLFMTSLSHNVINEEVQSRTIRFIVTKTTRENIVLGKFLGIMLFWVVCLLVAFILLIPFAKSFYFPELMETIIFMSYFAGFTLLISTIINKPSMTMFFGMVTAIGIPVIGLWSIGSENIIIKVISYVTPYFYYNQEDTFLAYFVLIFPVVFVVLSLLFIRKKDL